MSLPAPLEGDYWTSKIARHILPWLVWLAEHRQTVTYSALDAEIVKRKIHGHVFPTLYGRPAGTVGNALIEVGRELGLTIPPLNALVIGKVTKVPGHGCDWYLSSFLDREIDFEEISHEDKLALVEEVHQRIFDFDSWKQVLAYFADATDEYPELKPFKGKKLFDYPAVLPPPGKPSVKPPSKKKIANLGGTGETESHRAMKMFIAEHPEVVGLPRYAEAELEYLFYSGDRVDILFTFDEARVAVEVKSEVSVQDDVYRGLHQCIKYRSLIRAEQIIDGEIPNGRAILAIAGPVPPIVAEHARRLNIPFADAVPYKKKTAKKAATVTTS